MSLINPSEMKIRLEAQLKDELEREVCHKNAYRGGNAKILSLNAYVVKILEERKP
jgi:hypothetical protein